LIQQQIEAGASPHEASRNAVHAHLKGMCKNVQVPKAAIYQVSDIMSNQLRFHKTKGRRAQRFVQSRGFLDAFLYFKFSSKAHTRNQELLEYWSEQRKNAPERPVSKKKKSPRKPHPPKR